jgi:glyoxylase-like metal-dependent hydrolase (beta-lactamase superfamily II)
MPDQPRIFAIRYARSDAPKDSYFYGYGSDHNPAPMDFSIWLIQLAGRSVLVDAGFTADVGLRRGKVLTCDPLSVLAALGAPPEDIPDVILTHLHYDHCGLIRSFPAARIWVQEREMAFWTGRFAGRTPLLSVIEPADILAMAELNFSGRVRFVDGDSQLSPAISMHLVGGHSAGMQVVRVAAEPGPIVLASDASHLYEQVHEDRPSSVLHSLPDALGAFDRLRELAGPGGQIIPGHDPSVRLHFPVVPGFDGEVVELTLGAAVADAGEA